MPYTQGYIDAQIMELVVIVTLIAITGESKELL